LKKGIQITKQLAQDNKYTEMNNRIKWLAQRASYDPVNYAFGFLRNGFTANPSGYANFNNGALALFSASQTYENGASGTQSNYSTAALNYDNFNLGMVNLMEQKSSHGTLIEFMGGLTLVVPPALKKTAVAITESELDPDTAENAINVYKGACKVVVVPFLGAAGGGSDTAWYLMAKGHKLNFKWRTRPEYDTEVDFDTGVSKHKVEAEYIMGASDWRGTYGSTGTV
jgi:hypothetical protein